MNLEPQTRPLYLVLLLLAVSALCLLGGSYWVNTQFNNLLQASVQTETLKSSLLSLRRHEKDFMLRLQDSYIYKHQQEIAATLQDLDKLSRHLSDIGYDSVMLEPFKSSILEYQIAFQRFAALQQKKSALLMQIEQVSDQISHALTPQTEVRLTFYKLSNETRYNLSQPQFNAQQSVADFEQLKGSLISALSGQHQALFLQYETLIYQLFQLNVALGTDENKGAEGELRAKVHFSESMVSQLSADINEYISAHITHWWQNEVMWGIGLLCISSLLLFSAVPPPTIKTKA